MATIEEEVKKLDEMYNKATTQPEYFEAWQLALKIEEASQDFSVDEVAKAILNGLWARYYECRKYLRSKQNAKELHDKVDGYYRQIGNLELRVSYGYLVTVIRSELLEDAEGAQEIEKEIQKVAKESGNIVSILRVINAHGLREMKDGDFSAAVKVFDEIEELEPIPTGAFRHAGNILNNRGAAKIRGDIDIISGVKDLLAAADRYLQEKQPPRKHLEGIRNRLREAQEKLEKRGDIDIISGVKDLLAAADRYLQEKQPPREPLEEIRNRLREAQEKLEKQS